MNEFSGDQSKRKAVELLREIDLHEPLSAAREIEDIIALLEREDKGAIQEEKL